LTQVEIIGTQGVWPQMPRVMHYWVGPEAGVCGSLGRMTGWQQPEMKTRLFAADGLSRHL